MSSYEDNREQPTDAWLRPGYADMGVDAMYWNPDGSLTAIECKQISRDPRTRVRGDLLDLLVDCPECAGLHGPSHGDLNPHNVVIAASGAYFRGIDPTTIDVGAIVVMDGPDEASTVDLHEVLRGLTPDSADPKNPALQAFVATHPDADHLPSVGLSGVPLLDSVDTGKVVRLLKHWNQVSRTDPAPSLSFETFVISLTQQFVAGSARCAVRAAYLARDAVVHQDSEVSRSVVARFAETWLGLRATNANIAATGNALLEAPLDGLHPDGDHAVVRQLRTDVRNQRRAWRFIGETQLCGRLVDSLDRPLPQADADGPLTVADAVASGIQPDLADGWNDVRLPRILARLRPDERQVTLAQAYQGLTWTAAAETCGMTAEFGERVRCKLKRLGADLTARIAATKRYLRSA